MKRPPRPPGDPPRHRLPRLLPLLLLGTLLPGCAAAPSAPDRAPSSLPGDAAGDPVAPACGAYGDETAPVRSAPEERAWSELDRARRPDRRLTPSGPLDRAARALARGAALGAPDPISRRRVQDALRAAGAFDPAPEAHLASGAADEALTALLARAGDAAATHGGVGHAESDGVHHFVLLLSQRRARLDPFPGAMAPGGEAELGGALLGLLHPRAWVTRPDGTSEELPLQGGRSFKARVRFPAPGLHALEVVGTGPRGPEVAALLAVSVGSAPCAAGAPTTFAPEPEDPGVAEEAVVAAANRLRRGAGLPLLTPSPELAAVARRHSEAMRRTGIVAHALPGGQELARRLRDAGIPFRRAFENVASGPTSLEAHAAAEASPAHRANLLAPAASSIGVGIARGRLATGETAVYLTEILVEPPPESGADRLTPDVRVREALWRERARRALPPLTHDPALEALARQAAGALRREDGAEVEGIAAEALRLGRGIAAADTFIATDPAEAVRSRNLTDARFLRVGVGVATGDSRRFGPGRLFIAVVYSD